jgi:hypothetical protein
LSVEQFYFACFGLIRITPERFPDLKAARKLLRWNTKSTDLSRSMSFSNNLLADKFGISIDFLFRTRTLVSSIRYFQREEHTYAQQQNSAASNESQFFQWVSVP